MGWVSLRCQDANRRTAPRLRPAFQVAGLVVGGQCAGAGAGENPHPHVQVQTLICHHGQADGGDSVQPCSSSKDGNGVEGTACRWTGWPAPLIIQGRIPRPSPTSMAPLPWPMASLAPPFPGSPPSALRLPWPPPFPCPPLPWPPTPSSRGTHMVRWAVYMGKWMDCQGVGAGSPPSRMEGGDAGLQGDGRGGGWGDKQPGAPGVGGQAANSQVHPWGGGTSSQVRPRGGGQAARCTRGWGTSSQVHPGGGGIFGRVRLAENKLKKTGYTLCQNWSASINHSIFNSIFNKYTYRYLVPA